MNGEHAVNELVELAERLMDYAEIIHQNGHTDFYRGKRDELVRAVKSLRNAVFSVEELAELLD